AGPGGRPRRYREESLVLLALVRTLWRLSYQDLHDWLVAWPALACACGLPAGCLLTPTVARTCPALPSNVGAERRQAPRHARCC
ncbi:MAG TPA: hypothetical protein VF916_10940, partial [Ktedonobacterales bacterium]